MKKYTEVYLVRKDVRCVLIETDIEATEQEVLDIAELNVNEDELYEFKANAIGNVTMTSNPEKDISDFAGWPLFK